MKLKNVLLSLAVFGAVVSLSSCGYKEVTAEEAAKVVFANSQKEDPGYTKVVIKSTVNNVEVEVSESAASIGLTKESVLEIFKDQGIEEGKTVEETVEENITLLRLEAGDSEEDLVSMFTEMEGATYRLSGEKLEVSYSMEESANGMLIAINATTSYNEFNYPVKENGTQTIKMAQGETVLFSISMDVNASYTYSK